VATNTLTDLHLILADAARSIIHAIGDDPTRPALRDTPARFARAWLEFAYPPEDAPYTSFESVATDELIVCGPLRVWSMCEHHLLPFSCDLTLGYLPQARIIGLSKLVRLAQSQAHRLQVQERLVADLAEAISCHTGLPDQPNPDVAVLGRGYHLCMEMRGAKTRAPFTTSVLYGAFRQEPALRAEFFALASSHA